ncbi:MAG: hypothetical protein ACOY3P_19995 [Planctomycetota bacterium]
MPHPRPEAQRAGGLDLPRFTSRFSVQVLGLILALGASAGAVIPIAYAWHGGDGSIAALVALALTLFAGMTALALLNALRGRHQALIAVLVGMMVCMGIPLMGAVVIRIAYPALADAGLMYYLLVFYLVALAVKTAAAVGIVARAAPPSRLSNGTSCAGAGPAAPGEPQ